MASNSLLEGLVFGNRIAENISKTIDEINIQSGIPHWKNLGNYRTARADIDHSIHKELKDIMSYYVGIVRSDVRIRRALDRLYLLYKETEMLYIENKLSPQLCELRNLITIGYLVTAAAGMRKESRGLHYTTDFPEKARFIENTYM